MVGGGEPSNNVGSNISSISAKYYTSKTGPAVETLESTCPEKNQPQDNIFAFSSNFHQRNSKHFTNSNKLNFTTL